jgi:hypothetical protein
VAALREQAKTAEAHCKLEPTPALLTSLHSSRREPSRGFGNGPVKA